MFARTLARALAAFSLGFALPAAAEPGFDVNDVSVLFPLDESDVVQPQIHLSGDHNYIPTTVFSDLLLEATDLWISAPLNTSIMKSSDWIVVGFRFDPCSHGEGAKACLPELRLIAQPKGNFGPADSGMHLVYELDQTAAQDLVKDLRQLKLDVEKATGVSTDGQPLGVHPGLKVAVEQKNAEAAGLFRTFLKRHAVTKRLGKLTMMGLRDSNTLDWIFFGGVIKDGRWVSTPVANLQSPQQNFVRLNLGGPTGRFQPDTAAPELSISTFFNGTFDTIKKAQPELQKAAHTLENPALSHRDNTDCISCHIANTVLASPVLRFEQFVEGLSYLPPQGITGFPAKETLQFHPLQWNLRSFGYFGIQATVNMRVVHESADAASLVNKQYGWKNPGPDCTAVIKEVRSCFVNSSLPFSAAGPVEDCLSLCTASPDL